ncbi:hypothetical protein COEREDRAFT_89623 [Coemansia reversa NRRL 1564]|uniref:DUF202 domain-containing protein n=1 Tax=Coemansia reversa (strain ATCC 12441 / NRRL 1564) TaxID=763665 RepID=A0A2G5B361_COERN|nr:hypothetical protein COEREDRAFT_89623 [Coemansia reversa NRRL 1564]|eukprot:PIA13421.1 hypothetical protein COEREDRAFT_89623 [Coemansia reversa NRRL 1564]
MASRVTRKSSSSSSSSSSSASEGEDYLQTLSPSPSQTPSPSQSQSQSHLSMGLASRLRSRLEGRKSEPVPGDSRDLQQTRRAESLPDESETSHTWTAAELLEVRARERTFDGAYWRTAVGLFGASLVILRVFGLAFFPVGLVFLALGLGFLGIGLVRRRKLISCDLHAHNPTFCTSGSTVVLSAAMCLSAYIVLLVLLLRI